MLMQEKLAADGLLYLSLVLFVGINGEVRLRFATPDVYAGADRRRCVGPRFAGGCRQAGVGVV